MIELSYVNVFVRDIEKAVPFYRDKLNFPVEFISPEHGYASFRVGPVRIGLAVTAPDQMNLIGRHTGVGLEVKDLDAEYERLLALGVQFEMPPTKQPWGGYMALVSDADGNVFYLDQVSAVHG